MQERQLPRMKALRVHPKLRLPVSVDRVPEDRMAPPCQMHADLVCAARFESAFQQRIARKALQHAPVRHGLAAVLFRDAHLFPVRRVAPDGRVDRAAVLTDIAADDAGIRPRQRVILELRSQRPVRMIVFCRDQQAGRVLVNAVDDARAQFAADAGKAVAAVVHQRVHERPAPMASRWMDDKPLRLVDHDHVRILIYDVQRDVFRLERDLLHLWQRKLQRITLGEPVALARGPAVQKDAAALKQLLRRASRKLRRQPRQRRVDALTGAVSRQKHRSSPPARWSCRRTPASCLTGTPCPRSGCRAPAAPPGS